MKDSNLRFLCKGTKDAILRKNMLIQVDGTKKESKKKD